LDNLRRLLNLAGFGALASDAVARDRQSAVKVVKLFCVEANGLLAAPAESFRPSGLTQHDAFDALVLFHRDFDSFIIAGGL
jgi:hypothetical protein